MQISKTFRMEAAHQLPADKIYGKCSHLHGHSYKLTVTVEGPNTQEGWVMNFSTLGDFVKSEIEDKCDHRFLRFHGNVLMPVIGYIEPEEDDLPTTAENLGWYWAWLIFEWLHENHPGITLAKLEVQETEKCTATITAMDMSVAIVQSAQPAVI